jgi:predicted ester cyclase
MKQIIFSLLTASLLIAACNNEKKTGETGDKKENTMMSGESKQERNKKNIMSSMEAFNSNDMEKVFRDAAASFIDYADGSTPPMTNLDSVKMFFKMLKDAVPDYKGENYMYLADGDHVAVIADWSGTFKNDLMGMKATGRMFKFKDLDLFKLNEEGKIIEHRSIANLAAVLQAGK